MFDINWWQVRRNNTKLPRPVRYLRIDRFYRDMALFYAYDDELNMNRTRQDLLGNTVSHDIHMAVLLTFVDLKKLVESESIIRLERQ